MKHIIRGILLISFQVVVLNNLQLSPLIAPQVFFLFILLLPLRMPHWSMLLIGFGSGLICDSFTNTPGMHAFTATMVSYLRYFYIRISYDSEEIEMPGAEPSIANKGMGWYMTYLMVFVFFYHLVLFIIEWSTTSMFFLVFQKALYSSVLSLLIIFIVLLLFIKSSTENVR